MVLWYKLWYVITYPCPRYLLVAHRFSYTQLGVMSASGCWCPGCPVGATGHQHSHMLMGVAFLLWRLNAVRGGGGSSFKQWWRCSQILAGMSPVETYLIKISRPGQNGWHFPGDMKMSIKISLKFVPKVRINNIAALAQIMAWRWSGHKPLSEPTMALFTDAYVHHLASMT